MKKTYLKISGNQFLTSPLYPYYNLRKHGLYDTGDLREQHEILQDKLRKGQDLKVAGFLSGNSLAEFKSSGRQNKQQNQSAENKLLPFQGKEKKKNQMKKEKQDME